MKKSKKLKRAIKQLKNKKARLIQKLKEFKQLQKKIKKERIELKKEEELTKKKSKKKIKKERIKLKKEKRKLKEKKEKITDRGATLNPTIFEVSSQSSVESRTPRRKSIFRYDAYGLFENEPSADKIEIMIENGIIAAFNSGKIKGKYLQKDLFGKLVESGIRGVEIRKKTISKEQLKYFKNSGSLNKLEIELQILNNGNIWRGKTNVSYTAKLF